MSVPALYRRIGDIVRERRRELHLTQEELASFLHVSRASIANIETGRQKLQIHQLYQLSQKLDIDVGVLLPPPAEASDLLSLDDLEFSQNVTVEQRQQIVQML